MKTLQELYKEILQSDELKKAFVEAVKTDSVKDFLEAQGCDSTLEEANEFLKAKAEEDNPLELSKENLDLIAGGTLITSPCGSVKCTEEHCSNTCIRECC